MDIKTIIANVITAMIVGIPLLLIIFLVFGRYFN